MTILAGLLLIISALLNYFSAIEYNTNENVDIEVVNADGAMVTDNEGFKECRRVSRASQCFSLYLYATIPLLFIASVFLFNNIASPLIMIAAAAAIISELISMIASKFSIWNLPGILGGALCIYLDLPSYIS